MRVGMSQAELGNKIGEADTFVAAMERGRVVFSKELVDRLGIALGVPPGSLAVEPTWEWC